MEQKTQGYLWTGQRSCHDVAGREIPCAGSGQDAETRRGSPWPDPRFQVTGELVTDAATGLIWTRRANYGEFPMTWAEALDFVRAMNRERAFGHADWRLPNRRELRSLISLQTRKPALPERHPFADVFLGWYWSSTTAMISPAHAWYVHLEGGRMFYGGKDQSYLVWPVRGEGNGTLPVTGQRRCFDSDGEEIPCAGSGQDAEWCRGRPWPSPRFEPQGETVLDRLTGLHWRRDADLGGRPVSWDEALSSVAELNRAAQGGRWRLPNINELESLVDCDRASPALPRPIPFTGLRDVYWSSTTSLFEPDWAWALYLEKGAIGVGQKYAPQFHVWPVFEMTDPV